MVSPYENLESRAFWRAGVANQEPESIEGLYRKKFAISRTDAIATAGSCFAQHISKNLRRLGYNLLDVEPPPPGLTGDQAQRFGYELYSARFGNIYVARQLRQLFLEAMGKFTPQRHVWERDGRFFDALRPSVEPNGLGSVEEVLAHRARHLESVLTMIRSAQVFVFTFGLTEAWVDRESGTVYATAPETIAGRYDPAHCVFKNFKMSEILEDFLAVRDILRRRKPNMRFLVTVSPVPLTATASGKHVLDATIYSKSVLRAVAGELSLLDDVDYFPSYELIASHFSRGQFYERNLRSVTKTGVSAAMRVFLEEHGATEAPPPPAPVRASRRPQPVEEGDDVVCEDILLEAFSS